MTPATIDGDEQIIFLLSDDLLLGLLSSKNLIRACLEYREIFMRDKTVVYWANFVRQSGERPYAPDPWDPSREHSELSNPLESIAHEVRHGVRSTGVSRGPRALNSR